jgi:ribonuclease P protein component
LKSFNSFPFKIVWLETVQSPAPVQIVISVPKRSFKKAVDRNKIKRQVRDIYRRNKAKLYTDLNDKKILLMLIYISKTHTEFKELEEKIKVMMQRLSIDCTLKK